jgi:hypothetical protein
MAKSTTKREIEVARALVNVRNQEAILRQNTRAYDQKTNKELCELLRNCKIVQRYIQEYKVQHPEAILYSGKKKNDLQEILFAFHRAVIDEAGGRVDGPDVPAATLAPSAERGQQEERVDNIQHLFALHLSLTIGVNEMFRLTDQQRATQFQRFEGDQDRLQLVGRTVLDRRDPEDLPETPYVRRQQSVSNNVTPAVESATQNRSTPNDDTPGSGSNGHNEIGNGRITQVRDGQTQNEVEDTEDGQLDGTDHEETSGGEVDGVRGEHPINAGEESDSRSEDYQLIPRRSKRQRTTAPTNTMRTSALQAQSESEHDAIDE